MLHSWAIALFIVTLAFIGKAIIFWKAEDE